ncbi:hypothetical protein B0H10DRAFT_742615 [Mycena sp. CBHHK59/15]|nr:hypothetical protein B0H10DRAFT_742615 [Mycena sp. CBHHK59/15]
MLSLLHDATRTRLHSHIPFLPQASPSPIICTSLPLLFSSLHYPSLPPFPPPLFPSLLQGGLPVHIPPSPAPTHSACPSPTRPSRSSSAPSRASCAGSRTCSCGRACWAPSRYAVFWAWMRSGAWTLTTEELSIMRPPVLTEDAGNAPRTGCACGSVGEDDGSGREAQEDGFERADERQPLQTPHILIHRAHGLSRSPAVVPRSWSRCRSSVCATWSRGISARAGSRGLKKWAGSSTAPRGARGRRDVELMGWASWMSRLTSSCISRRCGCGCGFRQQAGGRHHRSMCTDTPPRPPRARARRARALIGCRSASRRLRVAPTQRVSLRHSAIVASPRHSAIAASCARARTRLSFCIHVAAHNAGRRRRLGGWCVRGLSLL